jgi:MFS family permease
MLVLARVIQGLGGGLAVVSVYVVLGRAYPDELRPRAFTLLSAAWVLPSIVGPFVAGFLTDHVSWRAVFWLVIPFAFSVLLMSSRLGHLGGGSQEHPPRWNRLVFAFAAAGSLAVLQEAGSRRDVFGAALAVVGLLVLVPTLSRLLPSGSLRFAHGLPTVVMMRGVLAGSFFAGEAFLPLAVHTVRGATTAQGGLLLTIGALGWTVGSQLQGRLYPRVQRRQLVQAGAGLVALCLFVLPVAMMSAVSFWIAALPWLIGALGMGLAFGAIGTLTLELSGPTDQGANSAALQVLDSTGSIVFIGIAGVIYGSALARGVVSGWTFTWIWWVMAAVALGGAIVSRRIPTTSVVTHDT